MVITPPQLQYLQNYFNISNQAYEQATRPVKISVRLDWIQLVGRGTNPADEFREPKEMKELGTKYHPTLT